MNDVVMVDFLRGKLGTEAQPEIMKQIDFFGRQVGRMRAEVIDFFQPIRSMDLQSKMGFGVRKFFPGKPGKPRFLGYRHNCGGSNNNRRRLQRLCGAQNTFPDFCGGGHGQVNTLALVFGQGQHARE